MLYWSVTRIASMPSVSENMTPCLVYLRSFGKERWSELVYAVSHHAL